MCNIEANYLSIKLLSQEPPKSFSVDRKLKRNVRLVFEKIKKKLKFELSKASLLKFRKLTAISSMLTRMVRRRLREGNLEGRRQITVCKCSRTVGIAVVCV